VSSKCSPGPEVLPFPCLRESQACSSCSWEGGRWQQQLSQARPLSSDGVAVLGWCLQEQVVGGRNGRQGYWERRGKDLLTQGVEGDSLGGGGVGVQGRR